MDTTPVNAVVPPAAAVVIPAAPAVTFAKPPAAVAPAGANFDSNPPNFPIRPLLDASEDPNFPMSGMPLPISFVAPDTAGANFVKPVTREPVIFSNGPNAATRAPTFTISSIVSGFIFPIFSATLPMRSAAFSSIGAIASPSFVSEFLALFSELLNFAPVVSLTRLNASSVAPVASCIFFNFSVNTSCCAPLNARAKV